jgi:hypothetical protein|tara:strand:+ start:38 stop:427 length:390 start_codon:yes stop_codon:yes gene_type:complete
MKNTTLTMCKATVLEYIKEHNIIVELVDSKERDGKTIELWGFQGNTGFSTFECIMTKEEAQYASVLFYRLHNEYGIDFGSAERLAQAYVKLYKVMQEPMSDKEQKELIEEFREAIELGNMGVVGEEDSE